MKIVVGGVEYPVEIMYYRIEDQRLSDNMSEKEWNERVDGMTVNDIVDFSSLSTRICAFPRGGVTIAEVKIDDMVYTGSATCSIKDNFNKKIGRAIAIGRLIKVLRELGWFVIQ